MVLKIMYMIIGYHDKHTIEKNQRLPISLMWKLTDKSSHYKLIDLHFQSHSFYFQIHWLKSKN